LSNFSVGRKLKMITPWHCKRNLFWKRCTQEP